MTAPTRERILPRLIEDEMRESFLDYSMSVIVQRALPDVRDGLKPVHRRILYAMNELGLVPGRPYNKSAVDFVPNFDDRLQEPTVLPARLPNLIVNGTSGIAVGMATNIPPHNLAEAVEAINHLVDHPDASLKDLRKFIKGPDFPTGAIIYGREGIKECYEKGRGRMVLRARAVVEEKESTGKQQIVVTEIPYQVNKANLIAQITELDDELKEVRKFIKECKEILGSKPRRLKILKEELSELAHGFGDERRTEIVADQGEFSIEDLIAEEDMVITVSHAGYIKRLPVSAYRRQRRGGRGVISAHTKEDDWVEHLFIASTHDYVMFFTQQGQCYWLKVHEIPQAARAARGKPIISCIAMKPDERLASLVPVREFSEDQYLLFATKQGVVKKTRLSEFGNPRSVGIRAINIEKGDELIDVQVTDGRNDIVLATHHGMSIRFHEKDVRDMGRTATGVKGIELDKKDQVIDMVVVRRKSTLLTVTEKGMGKRSELDEYRVQHRGGRGIITLKRADKTGNIVALKEVLPDDELMMITKKGIMIRVPVEGIRISGRNTQGVKIMNMTAGDLVVDVARVVKEDEADDGEGDAEDGDAPRAPAKAKKAPAKAKAKAKPTKKKK